MKKIVLTFGLIAGAILSVMMLITFVGGERLGFEHSMVVGYATMVAAFLLIFLGVRSYRDNIAGGTVRFGRAFVVGGLIALVASVCYVATWQVVYYKLAPNFMADYQAHALESARADGASEEELAAEKAKMEGYAEMYRNPLINIGVTFLEPLPVALIIALVSAGVLSRRRKEDGHRAM